MKQFVKSLSKSGKCFKYLCQSLPHISEAKLKEAVFVGPDIRKLMLDKNFVAIMTYGEKEAWTAFRDVISKFLRNTKDAEHKNIVQNMLQKFEKFGCLMNLKLHFLKSHLDFFPANLGAVSDELGERFHQDNRVMERRYQGRCNVSMIGDYCWSLHRENPVSPHKRKSNIRSFTEKRKRKY